MHSLLLRERRRALWLVIPLLVAAVGCSSMSRTKKGAVIGGATGAVLGGVIGDKAGNTVVGAILGAAVGGAAGAWIGHYMDEQAEEIERDLDGARIERVGEGIKVTFDSGILFAVDKSNLQSQARENIAKLAVILNKYPDTNVLIEGHTDSSGSDEHNMTLSRRRAEAVSAELATHGVSSSRFSIVGYGESQPVASNDTVEGKAANRRVELAIMANEKLKKAAEEKAG